MFTRAPRGKEKKKTKRETTSLLYYRSAVVLCLFVCLFVCLFIAALFMLKNDKNKEKKSFSEIEIKINVVAPEAFLAGQQVHGGRFFWRFFFFCFRVLHAARCW